MGSRPLASEGSDVVDNNADREFISHLIDLYRDCPELWKVKSKDYFNKNKRSASLEKITGALKLLKPDYTVKKLKLKINVLRTNFNREFKRIEAKSVSGASTDDIPETTLWYYHDLSFIKDQIEISPTETSEPLLSKDSQSLPASQVQTTLPSVNRTAPPASKKIKVLPDSTEQLVGLAIEYFKRPETEEDILASCWAMKLKKLLPEQRRFAEKIINDTLFEAEMGTLTRDGVRFETHPRWSPSPSSSSQRYPNSPYMPSAQPVYSSSPSDSPSPTATYPPLPSEQNMEEASAAD